MRIVIRTLLLTIVVLVNFGELNAMENQESSSGFRDHPMTWWIRPYFGNPRGEALLGGGRPVMSQSVLMENEGSSSKSGESHETVRTGRGRTGRPRGSQSRRLDGVIRGHFHVVPSFRKKPVRLTRNSDGFITYMDQLVEVWLDEHERIVQAEYPNNKCPSGSGHKRDNYLVRLVILNGGQRIVECLDQNGALLGVRPSIATTQNVMEPSSTQWFFVYDRKVFRVRLDSETKAVIDITLADKDGSEVARGELFEAVDMAGFKFRVIRKPPYLHIIGAVPVVSSPSPTVVHSFRDLLS